MKGAPDNIKEMHTVVAFLHDLTRSLSHKVECTSTATLDAASQEAEKQQALLREKGCRGPAQPARLHHQLASINDQAEHIAALVQQWLQAKPRNLNPLHPEGCCFSCGQEGHFRQDYLQRPQHPGT